jgi:hypothetical protein
MVVPFLFALGIDSVPSGVDHAAVAAAGNRREPTIPKSVEKSCRTLAQQRQAPRVSGRAAIFRATARWTG